MPAVVLVRRADSRSRLVRALGQRCELLVGERADLGHIERHIIPALGATRLQQLTPDALTRFYADRLQTPGRKGKPLSPRTVRYLHAIVHKSLADAVRWELVVRNVADAAEPPS